MLFIDKASLAGQPQEGSEAQPRTLHFQHAGSRPKHCQGGESFANSFIPESYVDCRESL